MNRTATKALVNKAWHAMPSLDGMSFRNGADELMAVSMADEKGHRRFAPDGYRHRTTVADAARLMAVYDLARALLKPTDGPTWFEFLQCRKSSLLAQGLASVNRERILSAWQAKGVDVAELAALDYAEYVRGE